MPRSEVVGAITLRKGSAALFFEPALGKFTREGNSPKIKLASGTYYRLDVDGTLAHLQPLVGEPPKARPDTPRQDRPAPARGNKNRASQFGKSHARRQESTGQVSHHTDDREASADLTEEDLRRLRGEIPLTTQSNKKWQR